MFGKYEVFGEGGVSFLLSLDFFMPTLWIYACVPAAPNRLSKFAGDILPTFVIL